MGFWDESFWLPVGTTWSDLKSNATIRYPQVEDFQYTIVIGLGLVVFRVLVEAFIFVPIGWTFGWIQTPLFSRIFTHLFGGFCGSSKFKRVAESTWRFFCFLSFFLTGCYVLYDQPQLRDVSECWRNWPHHHLPSKAYWYYLTEGGYYWSLLIGTVFLDVRRADFAQMTLHHCVTLCLLWISWSINMVRVGTLILFSHDAADVLIELAKMFRYARWQNALTCVYILFMIIWVTTRLVYYPIWVLNSVWFDAPVFIQKSYRWENVLQRPIVPRVLFVMLTSLLFLHIFWTYILVMIGVKAAKGNEMDDIREDSDDESEDEKSQQNGKKLKSN